MQAQLQAQLIIARSVILVNMHNMKQSRPAQTVQQDTTKTKMKQISTLAKNAKREDIKIKQNKPAVSHVLLGDTHTQRASLVTLARSVPLVSMHQSPLLSA